MKPIQKKRLSLVAGVLLLAILAIGLLIYAMGKDINHYYSLAEITTHQVPVEQDGIRVGGMVEKGSLQRKGDSLEITFGITDFKHPRLTISYRGILPDLFREGQGIIARGKLGRDGIFYASEVLAKHDATYMPPEIRAEMQKNDNSNFAIERLP